MIACRASVGVMVVVVVVAVCGAHSCTVEELL